MKPAAHPADVQIIWLLRRAFHSIEAEKERRLKSTGVTPSHYAVLINISASPGLTSAELARRLQVTPQNVAGLASKLEILGWIERRDHPLHSHMRELHLTSAGESVLALADAVVSQLESDIRASISAEQLHELAAGLRRLEAIPFP